MCSGNLHFITPISSTIFNPTVARPSREYISTDKTDKFKKMRNWEDALYDYIMNYVTDTEQEEV